MTGLSHIKENNKESEFEKEKKEHPSFTDEQIKQIVKDHANLSETSGSPVPANTLEPIKYDEKERNDPEGYPGLARNYRGEGILIRPGAIYHFAPRDNRPADTQ